MAKLHFEQIKPLVHGAATVEEGEGKISFLRFSADQQKLYSPSKDFYMKSFSTSGIFLEFDTDSENLSFSVVINQGSSRFFFTHSVFVNGERIGELSGVLEGTDLALSKSFKLGTGLKRVKIVFPWSVYSALTSLELDDGAIVSPTSKPFKMINFGDSITQGYDASRPENLYASQLAAALNAEARNKGIGGEQFFADLGKTKEDFEPDLITVAYGTNDWRHAKKEHFLTSAATFFKNIRQTYPNAKIVAITPIWRADINNVYEFGEPFTFVSDYIKQLSENIPNMAVIDGLDLVPHDPSFFQTDGLHPLDNGFEQYIKNLLASDVFKGLKG